MSKNSGSKTWCQHLRDVIGIAVFYRGGSYLCLFVVCLFVCPFIWIDVFDVVLTTMYSEVLCSLVLCFLS